MIVFAIDPGPVSSGFVEWNGEQITEFGYDENRWILSKIYSRKNLHGNPRKFVCELMNPYTVGKEIELGSRWTGRFWEAAGDMEFIQRSTVCAGLTGDSRAKKPVVNTALKDRFGKPGSIKNPNYIYGTEGNEKLNVHTWDAFSLAVYYFDLLKEGSYAS